MAPQVRLFSLVERIFVFFVLVACVASTSRAQKVLRIGASLSLTPASSNRAITGNGVRQGLELFKIWANERGPITLGNQTYTFDIVVLDDKGNSSLLVSNYQKLHADPNVTFLVGPVASDFNILAASSVTEPGGRLLLAYALLVSRLAPTVRTCAMLTLYIFSYT